LREEDANSKRRKVEKAKKEQAENRRKRKKKGRNRLKGRKKDQITGKEKRRGGEREEGGERRRGGGGGHGPCVSCEGKVIFQSYVLEAPVVFAGTTITPPALKRPRRDTVDSSPPPARTAAPGNPGPSGKLACIMDAPLSQSMDSVNTVATGEDEVGVLRITVSDTTTAARRGTAPVRTVYDGRRGAIHPF